MGQRCKVKKKEGKQAHFKQKVSDFCEKDCDKQQSWGEGKRAKEQRYRLLCPETPLLLTGVEIMGGYLVNINYPLSICY